MSAGVCCGMCCLCCWSCCGALELLANRQRMQSTKTARRTGEQNVRTAAQAQQSKRRSMRAGSSIFLPLQTTAKPKAPKSLAERHVPDLLLILPAVHVSHTVGISAARATRLHRCAAAMARARRAFCLGRLVAYELNEGRAPFRFGEGIIPLSQAY